MLKHSIGADECLTRQKKKHLIRQYIIIFYIALYTSYLKLVFVFENIPSYIFFILLLLPVKLLQILHLKYNMQDKGKNMNICNSFSLKQQWEKLVSNYERPNKEVKHLKMQNISISLRQPLAEFFINCALSDCISSLLPEIYRNAYIHILNTVNHT